MSVEITLVLEEDKAAFLAHTLAMAAFDKQKQAAFWEGMGDGKLNQKMVEEQAFLASMANIFAMAHWKVDKRMRYNLEEALENV